MCLYLLQLESIPIYLFMSICVYACEHVLRIGRGKSFHPGLLCTSNYFIHSSLVHSHGRESSITFGEGPENYSVRIIFIDIR